MLGSKQRAYLRALAAKEDTILMVGKGGMSAEIIKSAQEALEKRELIKGKALEAAPITAREAAEALSQETKSEVVAVIGRKFILYRKNEEDTKIILPKSK